MATSLTSDERCIGCWQLKSAHVANENGALECPPIKRYFTPCPHPNTQGWGQLGSDGSYDGESWCTSCHQQLIFRKAAAP